MVKQIPEPSFDYKADELTALFFEGLKKLKKEIDSLTLNDLQRKNATARLIQLAYILAGMNEEIKAWAQEAIPEAMIEGVSHALLAVGVVKTIDEARKIAQFNSVNLSVMKAAIADTQTDLLAVTENISDRLRTTMRRVTAEVIKEEYSVKPVNAKSLKPEILLRLKEELGEELEKGIVDAANRVWKPTDYVDMATRTKLHIIYGEAKTNEAVARNYLYAVISSHGAKDSCRFHEGRIVKLDASAKGRYPTIAELRASQQIFHPRCKHVFTPIETPDELEPNERKFADRQQERGTLAIESGKRNPQDID